MVAVKVSRIRHVLERTGTRLTVRSLPHHGSGSAGIAAGSNNVDGSRPTQARPQSVADRLSEMLDQNALRVRPPVRNLRNQRQRDEMLLRDHSPGRANTPNRTSTPRIGRIEAAAASVPASATHGRAGFTTDQERADALEAQRISRELDRQEAAAARQANPPPRGGLGAGGAEAYGIEPRMARGPGRSWLNFLGAGPTAGGMGFYMNGEQLGAPAMTGFPGGLPGLGIYPGMLRQPHMGPSIEDMWKGINYIGHRASPQPGYTFDFDRENNEAGAGPTDVIRLDCDEDEPWTQELGQQVNERRHHKPHLVCAECQAPLRVSEGMRDEDDRVFALRCGHVMDAKCYEKISRPLAEIIPDEVLGGDSTQTNGHDTASMAVEADDENMAIGSKRKRKVAAPVAAPPAKKTGRGRPAKVVPEEFEWKCPVGGCGRAFKSLKRGGIWMPDPGAATQLFV